MDLGHPSILIFLLLGINAATFILFGFDKIQARTNLRRVSERTLLLSASIGPFGAFLGMRAFRHKTRKTRFLLVPIFVLMHVAIIYLVLRTN